MKKRGILGFALLLCLLAPMAWAEQAETPPVGSVITFGSYEQDNDFTNGKEPIEWIVLDVEGSRAFLISKLCLDTIQFYPERVPMYWGISTLRAWLNKDFLDEAFTAEEQAVILTTTVANDNPRGMRGASDDTLDQIYLLSKAEALRFFPEQESRLAYATEYAMSKGCTVGTKNGCCRWWLRTPGARRMDTCGVRVDGRISAYGMQDVDWPTNTIRPVMWLQFGE